MSQKELDFKFGVYQNGRQSIYIKVSFECVYAVCWLQFDFSCNEGRHFSFTV